MDRVLIGTWEQPLRAPNLSAEYDSIIDRPKIERLGEKNSQSVTHESIDVPLGGGMMC